MESLDFDVVERDFLAADVATLNRRLFYKITEKT
jgi:hypothetical protein